MTGRRYSRPAAYAHAQVKRAVENGTLRVPRTCDVCGKNPETIQTTELHTGVRHKQLCAHHWKGYDYPIDVWWVCRSCNRQLTGLHDGSLCDVTAAFYFIRWGIPKERIPDKYKHVADMRRPMIKGD